MPLRKLILAAVLLAVVFAARRQLLDLLFGKEDEFVYSASGQAA